MPFKNLALGAAAIILVGSALAQNHHNTHIVRKGETLEKIAKWTGVSKKQLISANDLYSKKFKPGLKLQIPTSKSSSPKHYDLSSGGYAPYTIHKHDSDWKIANMFHMTPKALRVLNPSVAWDHPKSGTQIRIPMKNAFIYKLAQIPVIRSRYAKVTRPDTVVRNAPGSNAARVAKVDAGRHVRVLDRSDHWYKVRFEQGTEGWVRGDLLVAEEAPKIMAMHQTPHHETSHSSLRVASYRPEKHRTGRESRNGTSYANLPASGGDMLAYAESFKNTPYRYGQSSRSGTDCSGFALQVLKHEGVKMPRTAAEQSQRGQRVAGGDLKPGDLLFFHTSRGSRISHVGIYMGDGKFIHASSGGGKVQINSLDEGYYKRRLATARRVVKVKHTEGGASKKKEETKPIDDPKPTSKVTDEIGN